jgi:hypothetical protein
MAETASRRRISLSPRSRGRCQRSPVHLAVRGDIGRRSDLALLKQGGAGCKRRADVRRPGRTQQFDADDEARFAFMRAAGARRGGHRHMVFLIGDGRGGICRAGLARCLFSLINAAVVTSAIISPEFSPGVGVRNGGKSKDSAGSTISAMRRWAIAPISADGKRDLVGGKGDRLGVEVAAGNDPSSSDSTSGLSVTALASISSVLAGHAAAGRDRRHDLRLAADAIGILNAGVAVAVAFADFRTLHERAQRGATSICRDGRATGGSRRSNGAVDPMIASVDSAPVTRPPCRGLRQALKRPTSAQAVENCVPLIRPRPSLGPSTTGERPGLRALPRPAGARRR